MSDVKRDFVNSRFFDISKDPGALSELQQCYARLEAEAAQWIASEGDVVYVPKYTFHAPRFYGEGPSCRLAMNGYANIAHLSEADAPH